MPLLNCMISMLITFIDTFKANDRITGHQQTPSGSFETTKNPPTIPLKKKSDKVKGHTNQAIYPKLVPLGIV